MRMDAEIDNLVLHRIAQRDHGWGKPYDFAAIFVLDHAVPNVERPNTNITDLDDEHALNEALQSALRERCADLPSLTFVQTYNDVYDPQRMGPVQVRDGGGLVILGPISQDLGTATVGALCYGGHRWIRWLRYHLQREDHTWHIVSREVIAVS